LTFRSGFYSLSAVFRSAYPLRELLTKTRSHLRGIGGKRLSDHYD
jgi:hypothetical protein